MATTEKVFLNLSGVSFPARQNYVVNFDSYKNVSKFYHSYNAYNNPVDLHFYRDNTLIKSARINYYSGPAEILVDALQVNKLIVYNTHTVNNSFSSLYFYEKPTNKYLFQDGTEIKKYGYGSNLINLIPPMTFNTSPEGIASANSEIYSQAYKAFDGNKSSGYWSSGIVGGWLAYEFDKEKVVKKYTISYPSNIALGPKIKNWTFEAWNGSSWFVLDTKSNVTDWKDEGETREFPINNTNAYKKYRINITANNGSTTTTLIGELEMLGEQLIWQTIGTAPATKAMFDQHGMTDLSIIDNNAIQQLISDTPELLCWTDETGSSVTRQTNITAVPLPQILLPVGDIEVGDIENVNISTLIVGNYNSIIPKNGAGITITVSSEYPGYEKGYAIDKDTTTRPWAISGTSGWMKIDFGTTKSVAKYMVHASGSNAPQNITLSGSNDNVTWTTLDSQTGLTMTGPTEFLVAVNKISYYRYYKLDFSRSGSGNIDIVEIDLYEAIRGNNDIKIIISGDSGSSWKGKNRVMVDISDLTQVKANGFTPDEFNALTKQELASLFPNGKARFAFYLEQEKSTDIVQIDSLKINEKAYTMTPSIESLKVIYNLLESEKPKLYVSRDDGVTWKEVQPDTLTSLEDLPEGNKLRVKTVLSNGQELHGLSYSWI